MADKNKKEVREQAAERIFHLSRLGELGFRFHKTKGIFRLVGKFKEQISFSTMTSPNRVPDVNIFTADASFTDVEYGFTIGRGIVGNLFTLPPYQRHNLTSDEIIQEAIVNLIVIKINEEVLPFFEICRVPEKIAENFHQPCFIFAGLVNYFNFLNRPELIDLILKKRCETQEEFLSFLKYFYDKISLEGEPAGGFPEAFGSEMKMTAATTAGLYHKLGIINGL